MAHMTITGNLFRDPQLRYTQDGKPYALGTMAWTERVRDKNGNYGDSPTLAVSFRLFGSDAEHLANSAGKGTRITLTGRVAPDEWQSQQGTVLQLDMMADSAAIDLKFQTAQVQRAGRGGGQQAQQQAQQNIGNAFSGAQQQQDPWNSAPQQQQSPANGNDEPPF